ncbi:MAG: hypothetical protein LQ340_001582 [Diploschistes diacapsis]|nr:MAG: hypothetical protein LQ340_001582 [Diploschistes diacapsis]
MPACGHEQTLPTIFGVQGISARRRGCQAPPKRPSLDQVLGLGYKIADITASNEGRILPDGEASHRRYGLTFQEPSIFGTVIKTASEGTIRAVFGTNAKDWGIKPYRYEGFRPFCGDGLLSTDGTTWERSRNMLKPFFHKSKISNLAGFEESLAQLITKLPKESSTVDLDPLLSALVRPSTQVKTISF